LETVTPFLSAGLRFVVASVVLYTIIRIKGITIPWNRESQWFFLITGLTSFSIPFGLVYWGEQKVSSGLTSILFAVFPFCVALFSSWLLKTEKLNSAKIIGIVLGFSGIVAIFFNDVHFSGAETFFGMLAILASAAMQAFSAVIVKKHGHEISPFVVSFVPMTIGAVILSVASVALEDFSSVEFTPKAILCILYLGLFGSVATFVSYFWLLKRVQVVLLSLTSFITPIIAVLLGAIVLQETVSPQIFLGSALVLMGIISANFPELRRLL
jgi:drug/metabolite transporter (DMT)-like permease